MIDINSDAVLSRNPLFYVKNNEVTNLARLLDLDSDRPLNYSENDPPKPSMFAHGTCSGCKHHVQSANGTDASKVPCSNKSSVYYGRQLGLMAINDCDTYEKPETIPEGMMPA